MSKKGGDSVRAHNFFEGIYAVGGWAGGVLAGGAGVGEAGVAAVGAAVVVGAAVGGEDGAAGAVVGLRNIAAILSAVWVSMPGSFFNNSSSCGSSLC